MIALPKSLKVQRNRTAERELGAAARAWIEADERTPGVHASDLLDPRQAIFQKLDPRSIPDRLINIFLIGRVLHAFVLQTIERQPHVNIKLTDAGTFWSDELGISYSPDKIVGGKVRELKTTRAYKEPVYLEDMSDYLEQVLIYLAATQTVDGQLWVLYLNLRDDETGKLDPCFRAFDITLSEADLSALIETCKETRALVQKGVDLKDPKLAPLCREWKCSRKMCEYYDVCQPEGRYEPPKEPKVRTVKP